MVYGTHVWQILFLACGSVISIQAQDSAGAPRRPRTPDFAEFNQRAVLPIEGAMGFSSRQAKALFSLQISPQATLPHHWRFGATLGSAYTGVEPDKGEQWIGYAGPKISYKLKALGFTIRGIPKPLAFGNISLFGEHLWATSNVRLYGVGLTAELLKRAAVSVKVHRDYQHQSTWGQVGLSYNLIGQRPEESFQTNH